MGLGGIVCEPNWRDGLQPGSPCPPGKLFCQLGWQEHVTGLGQN